MVTNYKYNVFLSALQHLLDGVKKQCDARRKRMRIAALQYANGQMKHCDDLIEASQCFFRLC